jgi:hypothetical protein
MQEVRQRIASSFFEKKEDVEVMIALALRGTRGTNLQNQNLVPLMTRDLSREALASKLVA